MKIRTDFVTNSSSSSFMCLAYYDDELAEYVKELVRMGYANTWEGEQTINPDTLEGFISLDSKGPVLSELTFKKYNARNPGISISIHTPDDSYRNGRPIFLKDSGEACEFIEMFFNNIPEDQYDAVHKKLYGLSCNAVDDFSVQVQENVWGMTDCGAPSILSYLKPTTKDGKILKGIWKKSEEFLTLDNKIDSICDEAFISNTIIKKIKLSGKIKIGKNAFKYCENLKTIEMDEIKKIDKSAFEGCTSLESLYTLLPKTIEECAFANCSALKENVTTRIGDNILYGWLDLKNVTTIKKYAFANCTSLENIKLDFRISKIGDGAFKNCSSLKYINLPPAIKSISKNAFDGCDNLTIYTLSNTAGHNYAVTHNVNFVLMDSDFDNYQNSDLFEIYNYGLYMKGKKIYGDFIYTEDLYDGIGIKILRYTGTDKNVVIPEMIEGKPVTSIGMYAFSTFINLYSYSLIIEKVDGNELANKMAISLEEASKCEDITSILLPDSITYLADYAFSGCKNLTYIHISENVRTIGRGCFYNCSSLKGIYLPASLEGIYDYAFDGCSNLENVYMRNGKKTYQTAINLKSNPKLKLHGPTKSFTEKFALKVKSPFFSDTRPREIIEERIKAEAKGEIFNDDFWKHDEK